MRPPRLTYANVVSTVCLFILLGGGAYAATRLAKNSVGSRQIRRNAVTSAKVKDHSLLGRDFKPGQIPSGQPGPAGPPGSARAYAEVNSGGIAKKPTFKQGKVQGFAAIQNPEEGVYCLIPVAGIDPAASAAVVSPLWSSGFAGQPEHAYRWEDPASPCGAGTFTVITTGGAAPSTQTDGIDFSVVVP